MNLYILEIISRIENISKKQLENIAKITIPIEIIIQSLDDVVDIDEIKKQRRLSEETLQFFTISYVFYKLYCLQKSDYKDLFLCATVGKKPKIMEIFNEVVKDVLVLAELPFIEPNAAKKVKSAKNIKTEIMYAIPCICSRANAIEIYFNIIKKLIKIEKQEYNEILTLVKIKRNLDLIRKDISDINLDIKNKDDTPVSIFFQKYKYSNDFKLRILELKKYFLDKHKTIFKTVKKTNAILYLDNLIKQEAKLIKEIIDAT